MCDLCKNVKTVDLFPSPKAYHACLNYIQRLVDSGDFLFASADCDTDEAINENGCWVADTIKHVIKCRQCDQRFLCIADTYHGGGSFRKTE